MSDVTVCRTMRSPLSASCPKVQLIGSRLHGLPAVQRVYPPTCVPRDTCAHRRDGAYQVGRGNGVKPGGGREVGERVFTCSRSRELPRAPKAPSYHLVSRSPSKTLAGSCHG